MSFISLMRIGFPFGFRHFYNGNLFGYEILKGYFICLGFE